jgi:hypothetical protein
MAVRPGLAATASGEALLGLLEIGFLRVDLGVVDVGAQRHGQLLETGQHRLDRLGGDRSDHGRQLGSFLRGGFDALLEPAVGLLDGPVTTHDEIRAQPGGLLDVDLPPGLTQDLDAVEVEAVEGTGLRQRLVEIDAHRPDPEAQQRGSRLALGDDPAGYRVSGDGLAATGGVGPPVAAGGGVLGGAAGGHHQGCRRQGCCQPADLPEHLVLLAVRPTANPRSG